MISLPQGGSSSSRPPTSGAPAPGVWQVHTFKDFNVAKPPKDAFHHQILLEPKELPIVKEFFKKFGEVQSRSYCSLSF